VGTLPKDASSGPFAEEWKRVFGDVSKEIEEVDISSALSSVAFSIKGPEELVSQVWFNIICHRGVSY
jgi:nucleosome binding factor SPN SPT16 subunit